ncbi:MAG TPA: VCBS repeat-containing protein, partial [Pirellulales bacterium]|nr:VCBS repeat-containing protein [Pirellulales bacterium]
MKPNGRPRFAAPCLLLALIAALAGTVWLAAFSPKSNPPPLGGQNPTSDAAHPESEIPNPKSRPPGFYDAATESGIDFRMSFLPNEQGENFKINLYDHGCGVAVADYDGDGDDDAILLNQLGANALLRNRGDGTFENVTAESGPLALEDRIKVGAVFADYDDDADQDLYITSTRGGNVLLRNQGDGRFHDVTAEAGVGLVAHCQTPVFFDCDGDGDLDLFVTHTAKWTTDEFDSQAKYYVGSHNPLERVNDPNDYEYDVLFRNEGDGRFADATAEAGLAGQGWDGDVATLDFDDDGDLDLVVTNMFGMSRLYRNDGLGHFDDVTRATLRRTSYGGTGCKAFDYDNDGRLDLFIADMHSDMWMGLRRRDTYTIEPARKYRNLRGPTTAAQTRLVAEEAHFLESRGVTHDDLLFGNSLFHNDGGGAFNEVSDAAGMETFWPWGIAAGDFDNDGDEDAFLPAGMGYPFVYWPCSLMSNNGDGTFTDVAEQEGIEPPAGGQYLARRIGGREAARSSRSAATADFDGDGRLELLVNNFNDRPYYF